MNLLRFLIFVNALTLYSLACSAQDTNLFLKNLTDKLTTQPELVIEICNKRLEIEASNSQTKETTQGKNVENLHGKRAEFLEKFINFCAEKVFPIAKNSEKVQFKNSLMEFCSGLIGKGLLGYEPVFSEALFFIFSEPNKDFIVTASKKISDGLSLLPKNFTNMGSLYASYLSPLIEKIIPYGNFKLSSNLIEKIKSKMYLPSKDILDLNIKMARVLFFHGYYTESSKLYETHILNQINLVGLKKLIARIEYATALRNMGLLEESKKNMEIAEVDLQSTDSSAHKGWFYVEKAQLNFILNKDFKSANLLLSKAESFYKIANREKSFFFTQIARAMFQRKLKKFNESKANLTKANTHISHYQNNPIYSFEYYYQLSLLAFQTKDIPTLKKVNDQIADVMALTGKAAKYKALLAPLLISLTKGKKQLVEALSKKNQYKQDSLKNKEIDELLNLKN